MRRFAKTVCLLLTTAALVGTCAAAQETKSAQPSTMTHEEIAPADRIEAKDLAASLQKGASPLILQVGPRALYDQGHILNAEYAGPAASEAGLKSLRDRVQAVSKDRWVVLYCGCCPWDRCPNIRPALHQLHSLGFTHVQALYLPVSFTADWADRGFPSEK